jgi:hypothetical protein
VRTVPGSLRVAQTCRAETGLLINGEPRLPIKGAN